MKEEWKKIDGYNGLYSVSNYGGVLNNKTGRVLAINYGCRRPSVGLSVNGTQKWVPVCLLVARAFVDNPSNYYHVRFIDGDKMHHRADNLEWVYAEEY